MIKHFKKIVSVALCGVMMIGSCVFAAETKTANADSAKPEKAYVLEKLGCLQEKDESMYTQAVSRGDFAYTLGKMLKLGNNDSSVRYFSDVTDYDYATPYINGLAEMKIISVDSERKFEPSRNITAEEAVKMVVTALGYSPLATARGGYPMGYMKIAQNGDLLDGISLTSGGVVTWGQTAELLFNALIEPQYIPEEISNGGEDITYVKSEENTVLYELYGMEFARGLLSGANGCDIGFDTTSDENSVVIDNVKCKIDGETEDYTDIIGKNVYAFYYKQDKSLYCILEDSVNTSEELVIDIEDFSSYSDGTIKYYVGDKEKSADISKAVILYNKAVPKNNIQSLFNNLTAGSIRLIKTSGSGYTAAVISDCKPFVLKFTDVSSENLYSESDSTVIKLKEYEIVRIKDENGDNLEVADIAAKSVMNVYASQNKERIDINVTESSVDGIVSGINSGENEITIESKVYEAENRFESAVTDSVSVGNNVRLYLDEFGKVIYAKILSSDGMTLGYLIAANTDGGVFDDGVNFKIYTSAGEIKTYESASNLKVDGVNYRSSGKAALAAIPGSGSTQIIKYAVNTDGKINVIDTYEAGNEDQDATLSRIKDGSAYSSKYSFRIGKDIVVSSDTKFFCVPNDDEVVSATADEFSIVKQGSFNNNVNFKFEVYKEKGENEYADAVVYRVNPDDNEANDYLNSHMFIVRENIEAIDENGDNYVQLSGMVRGRDETLKVYDSMLNKTNVAVSDISEGDLLRYRTNYKGKVSAIELLYDVSEDKRIGWGADTDTTTLFASGYVSNFQISAGYVSDKTDNTIGWGYKSGTVTDERIMSSSTSFVFYDPNGRGSKVYKGNAEDIKDYNSAENECDLIFVQFNQANVQSAIVYKR